MEILVKITSQEIANASGQAMASLMGALQSIAQGTSPAQFENAPQTAQTGEHGTETAKTDKDTVPAPKQAQTGAEKPQKAKPASVPKPEPKKEEPQAEPEPEQEAAPEPQAKEEPTEKAEPRQEAKDGEAKTDIPDRATVRKRLADIRNEDETKAPKILEILHGFGVKKFSDLPDESLAEVLAKAEAL